MCLIDIRHPRLLDRDLGALEPILRSSIDLELLQACGLIFVLSAMCNTRIFINGKFISFPKCLGFVKGSFTYVFLPWTIEIYTVELI